MLSLSCETPEALLTLDEWVSLGDVWVKQGDEWASRGLDLAMAAKEMENIDDELTWVRRAMVCFADNADMCRRVRAHMQSVLLRKNLLDCCCARIC